MDSGTLRSFLRICELGSFGRAAQVLNTSQPTLSRRIALLEREMQAQLFARHQRGVSLTPAGRALEKRALRLVRQMDELHEELATLAGEPSGTLAIGLAPSLISIVGGPLIERFSKSFPRVELFVFEGIANEMEEKIASGELDIALLLPIRARLSDVAVRGLASEQMVLAAAARDGLPASPATVDDLARRPLILYRLPNYSRWMVEIAFQQRAQSPRVVAEVNSLPMMLELARRGVGAVILPRSAIEQDVAAGALHAVPISGMRVEWTLAVARQREGTVTAQAMIDCLNDIVRERIRSGAWEAALV
jgi:LysR family nitrogen assimilation transcriptional regulator